jgi:hypothetical protein
LPSWAQGVLENPSANSFQSGIGIVSGWKCSPGTITVQFDGSASQVQAAAGTGRADTTGACGGSANNGFGVLWNFNLLGAGAHTVQVFNNGVPFASASFTVTTLGGEFLTGVSGQCDLQGFPHAGLEVSLQWQESNQNFVIASASGVDGDSATGLPELAQVLAGTWTVVNETTDTTYAGPTASGQVTFSADTLTMDAGGFAAAGLVAGSEASFCVIPEAPIHFKVIGTVGPAQPVLYLSYQGQDRPSGDRTPQDALVTVVHSATGQLTMVGRGGCGSLSRPHISYLTLVQP